MASFPSGYLPMAMILGFSARRKQRLKHDTTKNATPTRSALTSRRRSAKMNVGRRKAKKQIPRTLLCAKSAVNFVNARKLLMPMTFARRTRFGARQPQQAEVNWLGMTAEA